MDNLILSKKNELNLENFKLKELNINNLNIKLHFNEANVFFKVTQNSIPKKEYERHLTLDQLYKISKFFINFETTKEIVEWIIDSLDKKDKNIQYEFNEKEAKFKIMNPISKKNFDLILYIKQKDINTRVSYLEEIIIQQNNKIELLKQKVKNLELQINEIKENNKKEKIIDYFKDSNILNEKEKKLLIEWLPKKPTKITL